MAPPREISRAASYTAAINTKPHRKKGIRLSALTNHRASLYKQVIRVHNRSRCCPTAIHPLCLRHEKNLRRKKKSFLVDRGCDTETVIFFHQGVDGEKAGFLDAFLMSVGLRHRERVSSLSYFPLALSFDAAVHLVRFKADGRERAN